MPGEAEQARAAVFGRAEAGEVRSAIQDNRGDGTESFDVVEHRGRLVRTRHRRERRPDAGDAALALERFEQRRFLAAFIGTRARVGREMELHAAPENVIAKIAARIGFIDRAIHNIDQIAVFAADIDVALLRAYRETRDQNALDHLVRIVLNEKAVFAGARLALIRIDHDVFRLRRLFRYEAPLQAGGETRAAAPAQARGLHLVDDFFRRHAEGFFESLVAIGREIGPDRVRVRHAEPAREDSDFQRIGFVVQHYGLTFT